MTVTNKLYSNIIELIAKQDFDWATDANIKCALLHEDNNAGSPWDQADTVFGDVSAWQVTGTNYTAGGADMGAAGNSIDRSTITTQFKSTTDPEWASSTIDATHAVVYSDGATKHLICMVDFGGEESSVDGTFKIEWAGGIVFTVAVGT